MPPKNTRKKPWYEPFYARVHEGIQQLGFVPADTIERLIEPEHTNESLTPINQPELKSYREFRLRLYRGATRNGVLRYVSLGAAKTQKGLNTTLLTCVTVPPVVRLLAMLQNAPHLDELIAFGIYNPHLSLRKDNILTKQQDQVVAAEDLLASLENSGLSWFEEHSNLEELLNAISPNSEYHPLAIACNLYRDQYQIAAEKVARLESDVDKRTDIILIHRPELTREQAEQMELSVGNSQLPNMMYRNREMIAKVKQACVEGSLDCILNGRTLQALS